MAKLESGEPVADGGGSLDEDLTPTEQLPVCPNCGSALFTPAISGFSTDQTWLRCMGCEHIYDQQTVLGN